MRKALLLGVAVLGLWPTLARAIDMASFVLKTTEDLYIVCSVPADDPCAAKPSISARDIFSGS